MAWGGPASHTDGAGVAYHPLTHFGPERLTQQPRAVGLPGGITPPWSIFAGQLCELVTGPTYHGSIRSMTERRARLPVSCHTTTREPSSEGGGSTLHPRWRRSVRPTGRAASLLVRRQPAHRKSVEPWVKTSPGHRAINVSGAWRKACPTRLDGGASSPRLSARPSPSLLASGRRRRGSRV